MKPYIRSALLCLLLLATSTSALAAVQCTVVAGQTLAFGTYDDSSGTNLTTTQSFQVSCCHTGGGGGVGPTPITVQLGQGLNSASNLTRAMKNTANTDLMTYHLYNASTGIEWGDTTHGGTIPAAQNITVANTSRCATPVFQSVTYPLQIQGMVPALQAVSAGSYSDTVTMTVSP